MGQGVDPVEITKAGLARARDEGFDTVIVDTAGRQVVDDGLMKELKDIQVSASYCTCVCVVFCVSIFVKLHITAQSGRHPIHSKLLALVLPRGDQRYLFRKPLIRRDKGDKLSLLVQFSFKSWVPCLPRFPHRVYNSSGAVLILGT